MCHFNSPAFSLWTSFFGKTVVLMLHLFHFNSPFSLWTSSFGEPAVSMPLMWTSNFPAFSLWTSFLGEPAVLMLLFKSHAFSLWTSLFGETAVWMLLMGHFNSPAFSLWTSLFGQTAVWMLLMGHFNSPAFNLWNLFFPHSRHIDQLQELQETIGGKCSQKCRVEHCIPGYWQSFLQCPPSSWLEAVSAK